MYETYGIGISMGANLLLRYQGLHSATSHFKALISICNPFDVELAASLMKTTIFEPYVATKAVSLPEDSPCLEGIVRKYELDTEAIERATSWNELNQLIISKAFAIPVDKLTPTLIKKLSKNNNPQKEMISTSISEYLLNSSCIDLLSKISVPTLII